MQNKLRYLLPSIADILFVTLFIYLSYFAGKSLLADGDTGYHIKAGELILQTRSIPRFDPFSFHSPLLPWTAHEWLSEIIMAVIHGVSGLTGIVIFFSLLISFTYYLLFRILRKSQANILFAIFTIILVIASSQIHWLARPHIFSLFFMVIWYYLLDMYQYQDRNYLFYMPLIMLFWVNLHGGYLTGLILIGVYLVGNAFKMFTVLGSDRSYYKKKLKTLSLLLAACVITSMINPFGFHILLFPFKLVSDTYLMDHVSEFMSPSFHGYMPFKYLLLAAIAVFALSKTRANIIETILILFFLNMSLYSARYIPLFAIVAAPIVLRQMESIFSGTDWKMVRFLRKRAQHISDVDALSRGFIWPLSGLLIVYSLVLTGKVDAHFDHKTKPVEAVEFLKKEMIPGKMFNNDEFGDYIIYAAWPQYKVFFDGRSDMYGAERMKEYFKIGTLQHGWEKVIDKYKIGWIIYNANSPLSLMLMERKDWKLVYADKVANIFVKNIPEYQRIIEKYPKIELVIQNDKTD